MSFTELVEPPAVGRAFTRSQLPGLADVTGNRARVDAIARWLQDIAYLDLIDAGFPREGAWIIRRCRIRIDSFPRFADEVELTTFCSGLGRFSAERRTTVRGDSAAIEAVALWIYLDVESWRPLRLPDEFIGLYSPSAAGRPAAVRLRHPDAPSGIDPIGWSFRATDLDVAGHVNNSHYWAPLEQQFADEGAPGSLDAEVEYREQCEPGPATLVSEGSSYWLMAGRRTLASVLVQPGSVDVERH